MMLFFTVVTLLLRAPDESRPRSFIRSSTCGWPSDLNRHLRAAADEARYPVLFRLMLRPAPSSKYSMLVYPAKASSATVDASGPTKHTDVVHPNMTRTLGVKVCVTGANTSYISTRWPRGRAASLKGPQASVALHDHVHDSWRKVECLPLIQRGLQVHMIIEVLQIQKQAHRAFARRFANFSARKAHQGPSSYHAALGTCLASSCQGCQERDETSTAGAP